MNLTAALARRKIVWAVVLIAPLSTPPRLTPLARGDDLSVRRELRILNPGLAPRTASHQRIHGWKFEAVELVYGEKMGSVQSRIRTAGDAVHRVPADGSGVIIEGMTETARGDLVSSPVSLDAFREIGVIVEYAVLSGQPLVLAALRPTVDRSRVDTAFLPAKLGGRRSETVQLHTGLMEGEYSLSLGVVGVGKVQFLGVSAVYGEKLNPPDKPVLVVDLMHPRPLSQGPYGWDQIGKLVDVFGFSEIEFIHPLEVTRERLDAIAPALVVLSPTSEEMLQTDPREIDIEKYLGGVRQAAEYGAPVVGICAGHHILAMAYGGRAGAVMEQGPDGLRELYEWGPTELTAIKEDPAFADLPRFPHFRLVEAHSRVVHSSFTMPVNLASSKICGLQVFRYPDRPWYTFQGHIESDWEYACPEGYLIWRNLLRGWGLGT